MRQPLMIGVTMLRIVAIIVIETISTSPSQPVSRSVIYKLTTSIPYRLNQVGVRVGALFSRKLEKYGLTLSMYRVMACLVEAPGIKLGDLADMLSAEASTMSRLIGTMVGMDLVTRARLPGNERTVSINLTPDGRDLTLALISEAKHFEDVIISRMGIKNVSKLIFLLDEIHKATDILESDLDSAV